MWSTSKAICILIKHNSYISKAWEIRTGRSIFDMQPYISWEGSNARRLLFELEMDKTNVGDIVAFAARTAILSHKDQGVCQGLGSPPRLRRSNGESSLHSQVTASSIGPGSSHEDDWLGTCFHSENACPGASSDPDTIQAPFETDFYMSG